MADLSGIETDLSNAPVEFVDQSGLSSMIPSSRQVDIYSAIDKYQKVQSSIEQYRFPHDTPEFYFAMSFQKYDRKNLFEMNAKLNTESAIILPLPQNLFDQQSLKYNEEALGVLLGAGVNTTFNGIKKSGEAAAGAVTGSSTWTEAGKSIADSIKGSISGNDISLGDIASTLGSAAISGSDIGNAVGAVFGFAPNQFFTVLFRGPTYKQFSFTWHLLPRNYDESETIRKIILKINNAIAPGIMGLGGALWSFPQVVSCAFQPNYKFLYRFKPSVISNFSIDYTPVGKPSFYHSPDQASNQEQPPESVKLKIDFIEMEYWLSGDFIDGGSADATNPGRNQEVSSSSDNTGSNSTSTETPSQ